MIFYGIEVISMRDPERLAPFYEKLWAMHMQFPDWRFTQLMSNFCRWWQQDFDGIFYMEDDEFMRIWEEFRIDMTVEKSERTRR